jgi:hypothetical protein
MAVCKACRYLLMTLDAFAMLFVVLKPSGPTLLLFLVFTLNLTVGFSSVKSSTQTNRLQLVLNVAARAVTESPVFHHSSPFLNSLLWLKMNPIIQYEVFCVVHKTG